ALGASRRRDAGRARILHPQGHRLGTARSVEEATRAHLRVPGGAPQARLESLAAGRGEVSLGGAAQSARLTREGPLGRTRDSPKGGYGMTPMGMRRQHRL